MAHFSPTGFLEKREMVQGRLIGRKSLPGSPFSPLYKMRTHGSIVHSGRSFFFIAPEMCCLDVVRVIISPSSAHSFRIPVIWHDVVVVCEFFVADGAFPVLLHDLSVEQFPHFGGGPEFPISPRMMRILNAPHAHLY